MLFEIIEKEKIRFNNIKSDISFIKAPLCKMFIFYLLATSAIIRANFLYKDDMGRAATGYRQWTEMGRYVSEFLSPVLHGDKYLADISPLTQYIALLILALCSVIIIYVLTNKKEISMIQLIASVPLGLSPYFLECISYKYDAPYIAFSILLSVLPLIFRKGNAYSYIAISIVSILCVSMSYQASLGIFPALVIVLAANDWNTNNEWKKPAKFVGMSVLSYVVALILFKVIVSPNVDSYVSSSIFSFNDIFEGTFQNLKKYYTYLNNQFEKEWLVLMGIICVSYVIAFVLKSNCNKLNALLVSVASLGGVLLLAFGMYPILTAPSFSARGMYGITAVIAILAVVVCSTPKVVIGKIAAVILAWCFCVFSFVYGNALHVQAEYTDFRASMVAESLAELECVQSDEPVFLRISGSIGYADPVRNEAAAYKFIKNIVPITLREEWYWGSYGLRHYYGFSNLKHALVEDEAKMNAAQCVEENAYFAIRVDGQDVYVILK